MSKVDRINRLYNEARRSLDALRDVSLGYDEAENGALVRPGQAVLFNGKGAVIVAPGSYGDKDVDVCFVYVRMGKLVVDAYEDSGLRRQRSLTTLDGRPVRGYEK